MQLGKFSSDRDSALHYLCTVDWSNDSFGDVEAPTGYVWRISNDPADVHIPNTEFTSVLEEWLEANPEVQDSAEFRASLIGHFLITEDSNGLVYVTESPTEASVKRAFESLRRLYDAWDDETEQDD